MPCTLGGSDGHQNILWSIYSHVAREQVKSKKSAETTNTNQKTLNRGRHPEI